MVIAEALNKTGGQIRARDFVKTMRSLQLKAPRGTIRFDEYGGPIHNYYIQKVQMFDGEWENVPVKTYPAVSQFWTWAPREFMSMPTYSGMKGEWARE